MSLSDSYRISGPLIREIGTIRPPQLEVYSLDNGIPVYEINTGSQDVLKVEVVHKGARLLEDKRLASRATIYMMKEETERFSSAYLAEKVDFLGASLGSSFNLDFTTLTGITLGKYYREMLEVLQEVVYAPKFSQEELTKYIRRNVNELKVELQKNDVIAYREFTEELFGGDHIYGFNSTIDMYQALTAQDCQQYYNQYMGTDNAVIFLSGKINDDVRKELNKTLGQEVKSTFTKQYKPIINPTSRIEKRLPGASELQSSIMIGRKLFTKSHMDYTGLVTLNTILGGYFGSRLMKTIREEHGFTYGVNSILEMLKYDGFIYINTEVDPEYREETIKVIYQEIEKLQTQLVPEIELTMVKNYILGNIMNMLDGPFRTAKWIKSLVLHGLDAEEGQKMIAGIASINAESIQLLAQKYFAKNDLSELVVG